MHYEELDQSTRKFMLSEYEAEQDLPDPYVSKSLSPQGQNIFPHAIKTAIEIGDDTTLLAMIEKKEYWLMTEEYNRQGKILIRKVNVPQVAKRLAVTEFSTYYVLGLCKKLMKEGVQYCQVYRGEMPKYEPGECQEHEGKIVEVEMIHNNHRRRYWPHPGDQSLLSIPFGPGCHHLIRRVHGV